MWGKQRKRGRGKENDIRMGKYNTTQIWETREGKKNPRTIFHFIKTVDLPQNSIKSHESEATALLTLSIALLLYHLKSPVWGKKKKRDRAQKATLHTKKKGGGASHAENKQQKRNFQKRIWMLNVPSNSVIYTKWTLRASCYSCALPRIRNNMTNGERMYLHPLSLWLVLQCF